MTLCELRQGFFTLAWCGTCFYLFHVLSLSWFGVFHIGNNIYQYSGIFRVNGRFLNDTDGFSFAEGFTGFLIIVRDLLVVVFVDDCIKDSFHCSPRLAKMAFLHYSIGGERVPIQ